VVIRHLDEIALDRIRDRDHGMAQFTGGAGVAGQVGAHRVDERRVRGAGQGRDFLDAAGAALQGEAGVRAADVGEQAGAAEKHIIHGVPHVFLGLLFFSPHPCGGQAARNAARCPAMKSRYHSALAFGVRSCVA